MIAVSLLPITSGGGDGKIDKVASLIERSPEILEKIKRVFVKKKEETSDVEEIAEDIVNAAEVLEEELEKEAADKE